MRPLSPEILRQVERESVLRVELENAINEDIGLSLVYQPQIDLASGETIIATMQCLNQAGVGLSIDDFGTGYSSLSYLKQFPIQTLKIDRSFIVDVVSNQQSAQVASAVLALGHSLGLKIIAEGAEDEDQIRFLEANNCDIVQGYYFSKPLMGDQFYRWCMSRNSAKDG